MKKFDNKELWEMTKREIQEFWETTAKEIRALEDEKSNIKKRSLIMAENGTYLNYENRQTIIDGLNRLIYIERDLDKLEKSKEKYYGSHLYAVRQAIADKRPVPRIVLEDYREELKNYNVFI